jgi:2-amino-4-hydroxy-6-hydroxymethyldihydropteridine diphosphokinase
MRAILGMGSNVGDRLGHLRAAVKRLEGMGHVERVSRVYETKAVGGPPQPDYLNAAVLFVYDGAPLDLLDALQGIEALLGRVRDASYEHWGPRTIDLDILWLEGIAMESDRLVVPHARLLERPFALRPLVDVAPDAIDPLSQLPYTRLFDAETAHMVPTSHDLFGAS